MGDKDGYGIWMPNERNTVLSRDVFFKQEVVCNSRNDVNQNENMCPTFHVAPTEEVKVLQNYRSDEGNTASTSGGSNCSNTEIRVQDRC
jgi:hypothetical protein